MNFPTKDFKTLMRAVRLLDFDSDDCTLVAQGETKKMLITFYWDKGDIETLCTEELVFDDEPDVDLTEEQIEELKQFASKCEDEVKEAYRRAKEITETEEFLDYQLNRSVL